MLVLTARIPSLRLLLADVCFLQDFSKEKEQVFPKEVLSWPSVFIPLFNEGYSFVELYVAVYTVFGKCFI